MEIIINIAIPVAIGSFVYFCDMFSNEGEPRWSLIAWVAFIAFAMTTASNLEEIKDLHQPCQQVQILEKQAGD